MALMVCRRCTTRFAVGLSWCPQCTAEDADMEGSEPEQGADHSEDGDDMPKITVHGGPSNAAADTEGGDQSSPGSSSSASSEKPQTSDETSSADHQSPAPTTESLSTSDQTASSSVPSTDGATTDTGADAGDSGAVAAEPGQLAPYSEWTKEALRDEIDARNEFRESVGADLLPVSGNKPELAERLEADDNDPDRPEAPRV